MSDWEINAPDAKTMLSAAVALGLPVTLVADKTPTGVITDTMLVDGTAVSINFYGKKHAIAGGAAPSGVFAIVRWLGSDFPAAKVPSGVTAIPLPPDSPVVFA